MVVTESITETSFTAMAKDTRVTFDSYPAEVPANKQTHKVHCHRTADRQISYEDAENCVNEMSESFPALSTRAHRIMRQVSGSFNSRTMKVALILSIILNLLLAVPFGIFFGFWMSQRHTASVQLSALSSSSSSLSSSSSSSSSSSEIVSPGNCVPCSSLNSFEIQNRVRIRFSQGTMCCLEDKSSINDPDQLLQLCKGTSRESFAHFTLDVKKTKENADSAHIASEKMFHWLNKGEIGKGIKNLNGSVQVLQDGNYYIFSHLTLSSIDSPFQEGVEENIVTHSVVKKANNSRRSTTTLLMDQLTVKKQEVRGSSNTGVFYLEKGEEIFVFITVPELLKASDNANVFGLFLI